MTYLDKLVDYTINTPHNTNAAVVKSLAERYAEEMGAINGGDDILNAMIDGSITEINSNATSIGLYAFKSRFKLTTVNFPIATEIGNYAFQDCNSLTTADFPNTTEIGTYAFKDCKALTIINSPVVTSIENNAFENCSSLTTADFPLATSILSNTFSGCKSLITADFPVATSIGRLAFSGCSGLTTVNFLTATEIGYNAFGDCSSLITADFPAVTSIGNNAFYGCSSLTNLILRSETMATLSAAIAFGSSGVANGTGYIYVPSALIDSYKAAENWSVYANQFRALEDYTIDGTITGELDPDKI